MIVPHLRWSLGRRWELCLVGFLAAAVVGCGGPKETKVSGRVLLDGKPVPGGRVTFRSDTAAANTISAELDEQGHWEAVLPLGKVHVLVDNRELEPRPPRRPGIMPGNLPADIREKLGGNKPPPAVENSITPKPNGRYVKLPEKYYVAESADLDFTVEPNMPPHDIQLSSK